MKPPWVNPIFDNLRKGKAPWLFFLAPIYLPLLVGGYLISRIPKAKRVSAEQLTTALIQNLEAGKYSSAQAMVCTGKKQPDFLVDWPRFTKDLGGKVAVKNVRREGSEKIDGGWVVNIVATVKGAKKTAPIKVGVITRFSSDGACVSGVGFSEK